MENENDKRPHRYSKITRRMSFQDWNRFNIWLLDEFPEKKVSYNKQEAKELLASMKRNLNLPEGSLESLNKKLNKKKNTSEEKITKKFDKTITKIIRRKAKEAKRDERKDRKTSREKAKIFSEHHYRTNDTGNYWRSSEFFRESLNDKNEWETHFMNNF